MPTQATDKYDYRSAGFNSFMHRRVSGASIDEQETGDDSSYRIRQLSGTSINSGISKSGDEKLTVDWNEAQITVTDGARTRVEIGKISGSDDYGIKIFDTEGELIFSAEDGIEGVSASKITTGTLSSTATINVGNNNIIIDGGNRRIIVNDGTYDRVLIGYQENGF